MAPSVENAPPQLPFIDLSELDGPQHNQVAELVKAAERFGFIHVVNHGVPVELLQELKDLAHSFHSQPEEKKTIYLQEVRPSPLATFLPRRAGSTSTLESLVLKYTNEEDAWKYWPEECREATLKYVEASSKLTERVLGVLMSNLGVTLDESLVYAYMGEKCLFINHYRSSSDRDQVGTKHADMDTLTVLLQDHIGGLFCKLREEGDMENNYSKEWVEIKPIPDALVILVGKCLQVLSNGKYKECEHYAENPTSTDIRVSFPIFMIPQFTKRIQPPLPHIVENDGVKHEERSFGKYNEFLQLIPTFVLNLLSL